MVFWGGSSIGRTICKQSTIRYEMLFTSFQTENHANTLSLDFAYNNNDNNKTTTYIAP